MVLNATEEIKEKYNKKAERYDRLLDPMEKMMMGKWRKILCSKAEGLVLEAGVGTGANLPYYSKGTDVIGIDFSLKMLEKAKDKLPLSDASIRLELADIQDLPFENNYFDTIITACVFCSVPDPVKGFNELRRVVKPAGKLYMLEHVRSEGVIIGSVMDAINPLSVKYSGVNINRRTEKNIELSGMRIERVERLFSDIVKLITVSPNKNIQ